MSIDNGPFVWFDGKFVRWQDANVHVSTHALHYGSSVFEGIRAYETKTGTAIFRLEPHVKRMVRSCKLARIVVPWSEAEIATAIQETVARNGQPSCYVRPLVFRGDGTMGVDGRQAPTHLIIFSMFWGRYLGADAIEQGVDAGISSWRRLDPETSMLLGKIGGQYVNNQLAKMEAAENGFAEALVLDTNGFMSEGSGENLFVVIDGVLYTAPVGSSVLAGVTRASVIQLAKDQGIEICERSLTRDAVYLADEVFVTGTAAEITPIRSVDRLTIGEGVRGPITKVLQEQFFGIVSGELSDRHGWLTPVKVTQAANGDK
jgi:branched-chain amino acid aminotransferase